MKAPVRRILIGAIVLVVVVVSAVIGYRLAGRSWLDAVYMVVITVSSVGFGEASTLSPAEQWLTMGVILFGITAAFTSLGGFVQMMMEGEIERAMNLGRTTRAIERLEDHVVLCGYGRIGRILAKELHRKDQPFVVVDNNPDAIADAQSQGFLVRMGDANEEEVLISAGIERAKSLVTALPSDAANVFITLTSRNLNQGLQILARGEYQSTEKKLLQAGANRVVLPAAIGALRMAAIITRPSTVELMELVAGQSVLDVEVDEVLLGPNCNLIGKSLVEAETRKQHGLLIVAIKPKSGKIMFNPGSEIILQAGDTVIVMGRLEDIDRFRADHRV